MLDHQSATDRFRSLWWCGIIQCMLVNLPSGYTGHQSQLPHCILVIMPAGTIKLGEATTSYDADGDVSESLPWEHLMLDQLKQEVQKSFLGDLQQIPPMFSAIRVKGKRLYESAREGKVVERAARSVHVSQFDLTEDAEDKQKVHFYISCSKGTYIRSLAHDLVRLYSVVLHPARLCMLCLQMAWLLVLQC